MMKYFVALSLVLVCSNTYADGVWVNGQYHNVQSVGGNGVLVDGQYHNVQSVGEYGVMIDGQYNNVMR